MTEDDVDRHGAAPRRRATSRSTRPRGATSTAARTFGDFIAGDGRVRERHVADARAAPRLPREGRTSFAATLDARERRICDERILAEEPRTLQEIGDEFGVTRERVRQLEARVVTRLREYLKENLVDFEYYAPGKD